MKFSTKLLGLFWTLYYTIALYNTHHRQNPFKSMKFNIYVLKILAIIMKRSIVFNCTKITNSLAKLIYNVIFES
jgi:isoprenylcysteine carboxyl methyltransferase (ICMT) family protein YpbQ